MQESVFSAGMLVKRVISSPGGLCKGIPWLSPHPTLLFHLPAEGSWWA